MNLKNCVVTADALHWQKKTCQIIRERKGHYVLNTKDNHILLQSDIEAKFADKRNAKIIKTITDEEKRISVSVYVLPEGYDDEGSKDMGCFVKMESEKKKGSLCLRYFISDMVKTKDIFEAVEKRWALETHHQIKDVYLHEDEFRCTDPKAVKNIAIMNNLIVQLLQIYVSLSGRIPRKAKIAMRSDPINQMKLLLSLIGSESIRDKMILMAKER